MEMTTLKRIAKDLFTTDTKMGLIETEVSLENSEVVSRRRNDFEAIKKVYNIILKVKKSGQGQSAADEANELVVSIAKKYTNRGLQFIT